ncbi:DMT family transporter [Zooshikella harenae]|uniref:DMT family transporter n=1 Tax=Zooshikella harenae TaxID=2827238 RepID=A0ABS5ZCQ0_9GAMM|nr:DMT family transporter [Zooshikella harenae]MBU2711045.1 DMT family transporter [Zooshikella harenae]
MSHLNQPLIGASYALGSALVGSITAAATKYVASQVPITSIIFIQYLMGSLILLPWLIQHRRSALRTQCLPLHIVRAVSGWLSFWCFYMALSHIPLVDAMLLRNAAPLCIPLVLLIWLNIRIPKARWLPLILGFIGITLILRPGINSLSIWHVVGFGSAISLAWSMISTRELAASEPSKRIVWYYFTLSLLFSLPMTYMGWQPIPLKLWPWLMGIGIGIYALMRLYTNAYRYAKASIVAPVSYSNIVFSGVLGWLIWSHTPDLISTLGAFFVIGGGLLTLSLNKAPDYKPAQTPKKTAPS